MVKFTKELMPLNNHIFTDQLSTPIGDMVAAATDTGICLLEFAERKNLQKQITNISSSFEKEVVPGKNRHLLQLNEQIQNYFKKDIYDFEIPLDLVGTTFQQTVWKALLKIPYGTTTSYLKLAKELGNIKAVRAVSNAIAANRLAILIPCHRVIGSDGSLTGYAGGLWRKKYLLNHEGQIEKGQLMIMDIL
jgi:AraC family transcriptional regulator of adaptative response/methylated-DNA-[protein]-cysteine methyltransferase